ncbi:D-glycero-beta-D-manno-heptose 1-phosphate adenylyltransferase [Candidatus Poribacteria bacterium]|nr:D-glycero-beta-D-manno-heptose 1-phosphate adenylyltransferase [Candidatus Poribacteria bacterium]
MLKIQPRNELVEIVRHAQSQGKKVVTTNGCFDVLHVGHVRYLQGARKLGDMLIVAVNSDSSVRALKGELRPLVPEDERAEMLAALECVDYVTIFSELDPIVLLLELKPDIHVKGGDYKLEQLIEREAVESYGGKVVVGFNVPGKSTTDLIKTIIERYGNFTQTEVMGTSAIDVKESHESKIETNDKLEQIRRRYLKKISEQPEGYRQQLLANLRDKHEISPDLQEQLALEWGLKSASDI